MQRAIAEKVAKKAIRTALLQRGTVDGIPLCSCVEVVVSGRASVEKTWTELQRLIGLRALLTAFAVWHKWTDWNVHGQYFGRILWPFDVLIPDEADGQHDQHLGMEIEAAYLTLGSVLHCWWRSIRGAASILRLRLLLQKNDLELLTNEVWVQIGAFLVGPKCFTENR